MSPIRPGPRPAAAGQALDPGPAHQQLDRAVPDRDAQAEGELGMDPP